MNVSHRGEKPNCLLYRSTARLRKLKVVVQKIVVRKSNFFEIVDRYAFLGLLTGFGDH